MQDQLDRQRDGEKRTLSRNHVQKFHPTVMRCASPRLTCSSRSSMAVSNATMMLSFSLLMISGHAAGSDVPSAGRLIWTQLETMISREEPERSEFRKGESEIVSRATYSPVRETLLTGLSCPC